MQITELLTHSPSAHRHHGGARGAEDGVTPSAVGQNIVGRLGRARSDAAASNDGAGAAGRAVTRNAQLRELADGVVRHAACAARPEDAVDEEAHELMRRTCDCARAGGIRAEQLLILLKEAWRELPEAHLVLRPDANDVLARLISVCIAVYYAPQRRSD